MTMERETQARKFVEEWANINGLLLTNNQITLYTDLLTSYQSHLLVMVEEDSELTENVVQEVVEVWSKMGTKGGENE